MYNLCMQLTLIIVVGFICYTAGFISHLFLSKHDTSLEKQVALLILVSWMAFAMIAYLQNKELSIFFNAAGMGAVGNLLGIKTSELVGGILKKSKT